MTVASGARDLVVGLMDGYLGTQLVYVAARLDALALVTRVRRIKPLRFSWQP